MATISISEKDCSSSNNFSKTDTIDGLVYSTNWGRQLGQEKNYIHGRNQCEMSPGTMPQRVHRMELDTRLEFDRLHLGIRKVGKATVCRYCECKSPEGCAYLKRKPQRVCTFLDQPISYTPFQSVTSMLFTVKKVYPSSISISFTQQKQSELWLTKR